MFCCFSTTPKSENEFTKKTHKKIASIRDTKIISLSLAKRKEENEKLKKK